MHESANGGGHSPNQSRSDQFFQDVRYATRIFRRNPGSTAVIILSLAIGIGATTAVFSVTNALFLKPLNYPASDRLAILWLRSPGIDIFQDWPSPGEYLDIKAGNDVFEQTAIAIGYSRTLTGRDHPERVDLLQASSSLLPMLGAKPILGRLLLPEEDVAGPPPDPNATAPPPQKAGTAVLTYPIWQRLFGGDPSIIGQSIILNGQPFTVVGVLDRSFVLNHEVMPTVGGIDKAEIILPLPLSGDPSQRRGDENFNIMAKLKPGVTPRQAQADIDVIAGNIREKDKRDRSFTISVVPLLDQVVGKVRPVVLVLLGAVVLVLLIACVNVANLLLARASGRQKEIAIRAALGARSARLVRQLLTESVLLGILGGAAGLLIAAGALNLIRVINPGNVPRLDEISIDGRVLGFTFGLSFLTGIVFGLAPALASIGVDLISNLKPGGRTSEAGGGLASSRDRLRSVLVVAEIAISLTLLVGAGLLIRSLIKLQEVKPGFNADHVITMQVVVSGPAYAGKAGYPKRIQFFDELNKRVKSLPGVVDEGATNVLPLTEGVSWGGLEIEGYTPPPDKPELQSDFRTVTRDYFQTMQIPLIAGRGFLDTDTQSSPGVVLIDEKLAANREFFPGGDPVGRRVRNGSRNPWTTIVGVVGSVKQYGLDADAEKPVVYLPHSQGPDSDMYVVARTSLDPAALANTIAGEVHSMDRDVAVFDIATMDSRLEKSMARQRFSTAMLGAFAAFALILACIGIYAVLSFLVTQSTHDIGVRIALGAERRSILAHVLGRGMTLAVIGAMVGLAGAAGLTQLMRGLLYGTSPTDVFTFGAVTGVLLVIALIACYIPARRATGVDPIIALRYE
ncbi:MAG TPA: ABC transporter permease [Blastocatellia bacterium]